MRIVQKEKGLTKKVVSATVAPLLEERSGGDARERWELSRGELWLLAVSDVSLICWYWPEDAGREWSGFTPRLAGRVQRFPLPLASLVTSPEGGLAAFKLLRRRGLGKC